MPVRNEKPSMEQPTTQQQKPRRLPYGMQNWEDVRLLNYYYVDKTRFIPEIEEANHYFFFIRPRRFGKSLLMNMLRQYYDVNKRDLFDRLFGDLWIGQHPTPMHNQYLVLHLNFAAFSGDMEGYKDRMDDYCRIQFRGFVDTYAQWLPSNAMDEVMSANGAANQLSALVQQCEKAGQSIYLFIDEYDHFTNAILADAATERDYKAEMHGTGAFRAFFDAIKTGTDSAIKRCFITGVSPVTMDDLTSGFNIGTNYTTQAAFNAMVGFTEQEVRDMLDYYRQFYTFRHSTDELIDIMKPWYDNYCFAVECVDAPPLYNSDMVLYFLDNYIRRKGRIPQDMLDANIRTDYSKLRMLIRKDEGYKYKLSQEGSFLGTNASIIQQIAETGTITAKLKEHFPSESITEPDNFVSLLYYFGMLSISSNGGLRGIKFQIPNQVVREQVYSYLESAYKEHHLALHEGQRRTLMENMALYGCWQAFFEYISQTLRQYSSHRDKLKGEAFVHGFVLAQTCLNDVYLPISELDAGIDGGYADIYLQPRLGVYPDIAHSYVLELKYLSGKASDTEVARTREKAREQLTRYAQSVAVERTYAPTRLHRLVLLWRGMELAVAEEL